MHLLQTKNVFLKDLGATPLKCNHQEERAEVSQSLWEAESLILMNAKDVQAH